MNTILVGSGRRGILFCMHKDSAIIVLLMQRNTRLKTLLCHK